MKTQTRWTVQGNIQDKLGTTRNKAWSPPFRSLQTAVTKPKCMCQKKGGKSNRSSTDGDNLVKGIRKASLEKR